MTIEEFKQTRFSAKMKVLYKDKECPIISVDFEECLLGIGYNQQFEVDDEIDWVRCENVELVKDIH
jgi:hypothetical protein